VIRLQHCWICLELSDWPLFQLRMTACRSGNRQLRVDRGQSPSSHCRQISASSRSQCRIASRSPCSRARCRRASTKPPRTSCASRSALSSRAIIRAARTSPRPPASLHQLATRTATIGRESPAGDDQARPTHRRGGLRI